MRIFFGLLLLLSLFVFAGISPAWAGANSPVLPIEGSFSATAQPIQPIEPQKIGKKRPQSARPNPKMQVEPIPAGWYWVMFALTAVIAVGSFLFLMQLGQVFGLIVFLLAGWPITFYSVKLLLAAIGSSDAFLPNARFWLGYLAFGTTLLGLMAVTSFVFFSTIFGGLTGGILLLSFLLSLAIPALMLIFNIIDQQRYITYQEESQQ